MHAVRPDDLTKSAFSEFETYGNYCMVYHKDLYVLREIKTLRNGNYFLHGNLRECERTWLAKDYIAVSFEKWDSVTDIYILWDNFIIRKFIRPRYVEWIIIRIHRILGKRI